MADLSRITLCIRGMRLTVGQVMDMVDAGEPVSEILADYPYLEAEDIEAARAWTARHGRSRPTA